MERISKEAAIVLHSLYSQFLSRRKVGQSKSEAREYGSAKSIKDNFCTDMSISDIEDAMRELDRNGYLLNDYGDNTITQCELTDLAIMDCESAIPDKVISIADFISKFIP